MEALRRTPRPPRADAGPQRQAHAARRLFPRRRGPRSRLWRWRPSPATCRSPRSKPAMLRALIAERMDPVLFGYSYDYVGDLAETVSLVWPDAAAHQHAQPFEPTLADVRRRAAEAASRSDGPTGAGAASRQRPASRRVSPSSSWSPAACASASRRGWPSRRSPISARSTSPRSRKLWHGLDAALHLSCSPGWKARRHGRRRRRAALFRLGHAVARRRGRRPRQDRPRRLRRRVEMGRNSRAGGVGSRLAKTLFAHRRRRSPGAFPDLVEAMNLRRRARRRTAGRPPARRAPALFPTCSSG